MHKNANQQPGTSDLLCLITMPNHSTSKYNTWIHCDKVFVIHMLITMQLNNQLIIHHDHAFQQDCCVLMLNCHQCSITVMNILVRYSDPLVTRAKAN